MIRTFGSGVPIWTAYEVVILWVFANQWVPWLTWADNKWYLIGFGLILPLFHELHFYCIHRLIHVPILYKWVHSVHHNSVNPSPWSSLSMHPVEHLLYWSGALIHLIVPSHPLLALYHLQITGTGAVVGHIGFDKIVVGAAAVDSHAYAHYLHHKYFEVNYADGGVPTAFGSPAPAFAAHGLRAERDPEATLHPGDQICDPPAHHAMPGQNRTRLDNPGQSGALLVVQQRPRPPAPCRPAPPPHPAH